MIVSYIVDSTKVQYKYSSMIFLENRTTKMVAVVVVTVCVSPSTAMKSRKLYQGYVDRQNGIVT